MADRLRVAEMPLQPIPRVDPGRAGHPVHEVRHACRGLHGVRGREHHVGLLFQCRAFAANGALPCGAERLVEQKPRGAQERLALGECGLRGGAVSQRPPRAERRLVHRDLAELGERAARDRQRDGRDHDVRGDERRQSIERTLESRPGLPLGDDGEAPGRRHEHPVRRHVVAVGAAHAERVPGVDDLHVPSAHDESHDLRA